MFLCQQNGHSLVFPVKMVNNRDKILTYSGGGPIHARVPIHTHPQFSQRFVLLHGKNVYHIIGNYQIDHIN